MKELKKILFASIFAWASMATSRAGIDKPATPPDLIYTSEQMQGYFKEGEFWTPSTRQVEQAKTRLKAVIGARGATAPWRRVKDFTKYELSYYGLVWKGQKVIHIMADTVWLDGRSRIQPFVIVLDAGSSFIEAEYRIAADKIVPNLDAP